MSRIDYDTDIYKHYVRKNGWLGECEFRLKSVQRAIRGKRRTRPFTYFTFCASNAIDVFMLEQAGLVKRDKATGRLQNVYFCEINEAEFEHIATRLGSREGGFLGDFQDFVLFEDIAETRDKDSLDDKESVPTDPKIRAKFRQKELHHRFRTLFPLDVINFDPYGIFFPPSTEVFSPMLQMIERLFEWQRDSMCVVDGHKCEAFTLILTAYVCFEDFNRHAIEDLHRIAAENIAEYAQFRDAFAEKFGGVEPAAAAKGNFGTYFATILPKVIAELARDYGWFGEHRYIHLYSSPERTVGRREYQMMSSVVRYQRLPPSRALPRPQKIWPEDFSDRYLTEICNILRYKPEDVNRSLDGDHLDVVNDVRQHLEAVVEYREEFLRSLR